MGALIATTTVRLLAFHAQETLETSQCKIDKKSVHRWRHDPEKLRDVVRLLTA